MELSELLLEINNDRDRNLHIIEKKIILNLFKRIVYGNIYQSIKKYQKVSFSFRTSSIDELCENYNVVRRKSNKDSYAYLEDYIYCRQIMDKLRNNNLINLKNTIHITGSNGKGSTATILETLLLQLGYKVNKYINPSVIDNDMIRINGKVIDKESFETYRQMVFDIYKSLLANNEFDMNFQGIKQFLDENDLYYMKKKEQDSNILINFWYLRSPIVYLAFSNSNADFNIIEVVTNGVKDSTNILMENETCATILTNIQYGIGSNDTTAKIYDENGEIEYSNRAKARHKSLLGKTNVPMIVANQPDDSLAEIRRVATDVLNTSTFEYDRDWFLNDIDENKFSITVFGKTHTFNKSKILFDKYQTINFATALATLYKLEAEGKINKIDDNILQQGIDKCRSAGRPQRCIIGNYKTFFGKDVDVIYGVIKLNKSGVETFENIINSSKEQYNNYFIYTSNNKSALKSHEMYFFDFMKNLQTNNGNSYLVLYKKNPDIYEKIIDILNEKKIKYVEKNMLSQAITYTKSLIKQNINGNKNRVFITCDSMVGFDKNIVYLNDGFDVY